MPCGTKKYKKGGKLKGPSHKNGGIPIEVEGGEFIIKKDSVNKDTLPILESINENGNLKEYKCGGLIDYNHPMKDSRKRRK